MAELVVAERGEEVDSPPVSLAICTAATAPPPAGCCQAWARLDDLAGARKTLDRRELRPLDMADDWRSSSR